MDTIQIELARMAKGASLTQSIEDVDKILEQLVSAREVIANGMAIILPFGDTLLMIYAEPNTASITLTKLQNPVKHGFERVTEDLKKVYSGQNKYGKALDKVQRDHSTHSGVL